MFAVSDRALANHRIGAVGDAGFRVGAAEKVCQDASFRRIAAELGVDRETVSRHLRAEAGAGVADACSSVSRGASWVGVDMGNWASVRPVRARG